MVGESPRPVLHLIGFRRHYFDDNVDVLDDLLNKCRKEDDQRCPDSKEGFLLHSFPALEERISHPPLWHYLIVHIHKKVDSRTFIDRVYLLQEVFPNIVFFEIENVVACSPHTNRDEGVVASTNLVVASTSDNHQIEGDGVHAMVKDLAQRGATASPPRVFTINVVQGLTS